MGKVKDKDWILKQLEKKTVQINGCWLYTGGSKTTDGYRRIKIEGKYIGIHRLSAYIFLKLDLSNNEQLANHKPICSSKVCWNPEHLYVGTHLQNIKDYLAAGHYNSKKTHCKRGHKLILSLSSGKRYCNECAAMRTAKSKAKKAKGIAL